jgi:hypothetical protein
MESDTDTFTYSDIDPNADFHAGIDADSIVYVGIEVYVDANKEIRIDTQVVTDFYSPIHTVFRRFQGVEQGQNRLGGQCEVSATDFTDGGGCVGLVSVGHTLRRPGTLHPLAATLMPHAATGSNDDRDS